VANEPPVIDIKRAAPTPEPEKEKINWEKRTYEIAKACSSGCLANPHSATITPAALAANVYAYAEALVLKLKLEGRDK